MFYNTLYFINTMYTYNYRIKSKKCLFVKVQKDGKLVL